MSEKEPSKYFGVDYGRAYKPVIIDKQYEALIYGLDALKNESKTDRYKALSAQLASGRLSLRPIERAEIVRQLDLLVADIVNENINCRKGNYTPDSDFLNT